MKKIFFLMLSILLVGCANEEIVNDNEGGDKVSGEIVVVETSEGNFEIELNSDKAPISVENFLKYVDEGFYDGTIFHRVIDNFMIQGGGFDTNFNEKQTKEPIKNEADNGLKNEKYAVTFARTNVVDSATSQFFINIKNNEFLDHKDQSLQGYGYAVFGKVTSGTDVVDKIKGVKTASRGGHDDVPVENVVIKKIYRKEG